MLVVSVRTKHIRIFRLSEPILCLIIIKTFNHPRSAAVTVSAAGCFSYETFDRASLLFGSNHPKIPILVGNEY